MPIHDFQAEDGEVISVYVKASEPKEAHAQQVRPEDGKVFKRVYVSGGGGVAKDTDVRDATKEDFARITDGKNYTVGEMWEKSKELSQRRAEKHGGKDPVLEKYYENYEKENRTKHADVLKQNRQESIDRLRKEWGVKIEF